MAPPDADAVIEPVGSPEGRRRPIVRPLRLATGLVLLAYVTSHFINHAFGVASVNAMEAASAVLLKPWQTSIGLTLLYGSFFIHGFLGLRSLYRRRHLRIPAGEAWQLALGLAIPLLLIPHAAGIRIGTSLFDLDYNYPSLIHRFWAEPPFDALLRQYVLLLVVWIHACLGLRAWLRSKLWFRRAAPLLASVAVLLPALAAFGIAAAGFDMRERLHRDPGYAQRFAPPPPGSVRAQHIMEVGRIVDGLSLSYLALVGATFLLRTGRDWRARRVGAVRITYPNERVVTVPAGFSVLEASRWAGIPHASVCGGRGRCSTCRVRVTRGAAALEPPGPAEARTLARIGAAPNIRLACQFRPRADLTVEPLVPAGVTGVAPANRFAAAVEGGRELEIAALFVDLRESTRLATGRLPYDALFLFDRYIQVVSTAVRQHGGLVTSIAGDGVMSVFGVGGDPVSATREAFRAAREVWEGLDSLNQELAPELESPLRIGIGLHTGPAIVGVLDRGDGNSLQFLGDTGNVAAKLEAHAKELACPMVASLQAVRWLATATAEVETAAAKLPGKEELVTIALFRTLKSLHFLLSSVAR
jgi:adenylate cyclase